ncbi:MAG TPA: hypothetical protein VNW25_05295 [Candidatus Sulfotelmatobacter sp.]|nr:hypothetical protein [Candidatus Sulfotelmatobacter sp.]
MKNPLFWVGLAGGLDSILGFASQQILVKPGKDTGRFLEGGITGDFSILY